MFAILLMNAMGQDKFCVSRRQVSEIYMYHTRLESEASR